MNPLLESLRLLSDPTRLRLLALLKQEPLSVAELQEILAMKQSRISTQLALLKQAELVTARRSGKNSIYELGDAITATEQGQQIRDMLELCCEALPDTREDLTALRLAVQKRSDKVRQYFDQLAGKFGRTYVPGRSWKSLSETLLKLLPPLVIADLGAGEGTFSQLLAQRAERVIAVDNSEAMVAYGTKVAAENGVTNLEYRVGDIQAPPIEDSSVDLAFFSQALHHARKPEVAVAAAARICRPGGRIVILDLLKHDFEKARELYQHEWLGFSEPEIYGFLEKAGFRDLHVSIVDRETEHPHLQTLLAIGTKPRASA
jgi:ubiquinone/menaquinone biosynthesis C-methylase UbiE/predicted transcriptional regulator